MTEGGAVMTERLSKSLEAGNQLRVGRSRHLFFAVDPGSPMTALLNLPLLIADDVDVGHDKAFYERVRDLIAGKPSRHEVDVFDV
jgi:hypothetical protein